MPLLFDSDPFQPLWLFSVLYRCRVYHSIIFLDVVLKQDQVCLSKRGEQENQTEAAGNLEEAATQEGSWDAAEVANQSSGRRIWSRWPTARQNCPEKRRKKLTEEATGAQADVANRNLGSCFSCTALEMQQDGASETLSWTVCMWVWVCVWAWAGGARAHVRRKKGRKKVKKKSQSVTAHYGKHTAHGGSSEGTHTHVPFVSGVTLFHGWKKLTINRIFVTLTAQKHIKPDSGQGKTRVYFAGLWTLSRQPADYNYY